MSKATNDNLLLSAASESAVGNGVAVDVVTSQNIKDEKLLWVTINGINMTLNTHYSVSLILNKITFTAAPAVGQLINVKYIVR